jgi:uncharacterized protein (TIGR03435 family)
LVALASAAAVVLAIAISPLIVVAEPQAKPAAQPEFEVASVKPNNSGNPSTRVRLVPDVNVENATLKALVLLAYDVKEFQVSGGPGWIDTERYDIQAKAVAPSMDEKGRLLQRQRLQTLLQERFKIAFHRETKELPVYELTVAKSGLKLRPLKEGDCIALDPQNPTIDPKKTPMDYCGSGRQGRGLLELANTTMAYLASSLSRITGRIVVDKTGMTGTFRIHLTFVPDDTMNQLPGPAIDPGGTPALDGPSLFDAVQEQLGLKLESTKGPVEVLVVDHAEKPSAN